MLLVSALTINSLQPTRAQESTSSLNQLWQLVEANYPGLSAQQASIEASQLQAQAVRSNALPQAKLQLQNSYGTHERSNGAFFPQPGLFNVNSPAGTVGSSTSANSFGSATLEYEVFSFGRQQAENSAAGFLTSRKQADKVAYSLKLKRELSNRYIQYLYTESKLQWVAKNATRLHDIQRIAAGLSRAGLKPAADSLLAYSSYIQALAEKDNWTGNKGISLARLQELHGQEDYAVDATASKFNKPALRLNPQADQPNLHPFLEVLAKESAYHKGLAAAQTKAALPSLKVLAGYAFRGSGIAPTGHVSGDWSAGFSNSSNNLLLGLGLTWNLTGMHTSKLKGNAWLKQAEQAQQQQAESQLYIQAGLKALDSKLSEQLKQLNKTEQSVSYTQDAYQMYMARYKSGLITMTELLQIRMLLEQAENNHIEALNSYWLQLAEEAMLRNDFQFLFNNL